MDHIIYKDKNLCIWYSEDDGEMHLQQNKIISFKDFIREIDTIPNKTSDWKQAMIYKYAYLTGIFKDVA